MRGGRRRHRFPASPASDLAGGDGNGVFDVFLHGSLMMADGFESGDLTAWSQHFP